MKKSTIVLMFIVVLINTSVAHEQAFHQYVVREGYNLLKAIYNDKQDISAINNHVGTNEMNGPWTTAKIVAGAYREDSEDVMFEYNLQNPPKFGGLVDNFETFVRNFYDLFWDKDPFITCTHFWNPDFGDDINAALSGSLGDITFTLFAPNSFYKFKHYGSGYWVYNWHSTTSPLKMLGENGHTYRFEQYTEGDLIIPFYYVSLPKLYKDGFIRPFYTTGSNFKVFDESDNDKAVILALDVKLPDDFREKFVWEILGRMAHLLTDATVPAHAHYDMHGVSDISGIGADSYEPFFKDQNNYYWTADKILESSSLSNNSVIINPYLSSNDPLHCLMYTTAQITGYFGSNGPYKGDGNSVIAGNCTQDEIDYISEQFSTFVPMIDGYNITVMRGNDNEYTPPIKEYIRDKTIPHLLKATAGLLYWFGCEANILYNTSQKICVRNELEGQLYNYTIGQVNVRGGDYQSPYTYENFVNAPFNISAVSVIQYNGEYYYFDHWSDVGAQSHDVYVPLSSVVSTEKSSYDAIFTAYYKKAPFITIQNKIWDLGVTTCGDVVVDGGSHTSPYTVQWVPGSSHTIATSVSGLTYNSKYYYYISWTDNPNGAHTIIAPNTATTYSACYKAKPVLTGTYDASTSKSTLSIPGWDSRPPNSNFWPQHYEDYSAVIPGWWMWINIGSPRPYPNTLLTYTHPITFIADASGRMDNAFVWYVNSIASNILAIQKGVIGDPIVASSNTEEATAFSNGKKLVIDSKGKLHVVFASNDSVYYTTSTDDGETWSTQVAIGQGKNPAIELKSISTGGSKSISGEMPSICYATDNEILLRDNTDAGNWTAPQTVYTGGAFERITYLSYVYDQARYKGYVGWVSVNDMMDAPSSVYIMTLENSKAKPSKLLLLDSDISKTAFKSPSLALDRAGNLKAAWSHSGTVYYYDENGQIELGQNGVHPIVDTYGDRNTVVWQDETEPDNYRVVRKVKTPDGWGDNQAISWADSGDAKYPTVAATGQYAFTKENGNGDYDIYYLGEYENGNYITTQNISGASGGQSYYPTIAYRQSWPKHKMYFLWTEKADEGSKVILTKVKVYATDVMPVATFGVYPNIDFASCYTIQRAGAFNYGTGRYEIVDYHPTKLKYHFEGLDPYKRYKAKVVYYRNVGDETDNPSSDWLEKLKVDNVSLKLSHVPDSTIVTEEALIPPNCYKDGIIDVTIDKIKGDYAICAMLEIIEYEGDGKAQGGAQSEEITSITPNYINKLYQNCPNPFSHKTSFNYQIKNQCLVTFKVYNALGQLVNTLVNETKPAGAYQVEWDGKDGCGLKVSSGVYIYRLQTGDFMDTKKMVVIK